MRSITRTRARCVFSMGLAAMFIAASAACSNAQDQVDESKPIYKRGESWPGRNFNGLDFAEPFVPVAAAGKHDFGRIVLNSMLPYSLLAASFFQEPLDSTSRGATREIQRWHWAHLDARYDHYPFVFTLAAVGFACAFLPTGDEDPSGYDWDLRLDRVTVFSLGMILSTAQREVIWRIYDRERPDKNGNDARPSGHAASGFAAMAFASNVIRDWLRPQDEDNVPLRIGKELFSALPYAGAFVLIFSRVEVRRHYLTDTLLGGAIGAFTMNLFYSWSFTEREQGRHWIDFAWIVAPGPHAFEVALVGSF